MSRYKEGDKAVTEGLSMRDMVQIEEFPLVPVPPVESPYQILGKNVLTG